MGRADRSTAAGLALAAAVGYGVWWVNHNLPPSEPTRLVHELLCPGMEPMPYLHGVNVAGLVDLDGCHDRWRPE